MGEFDLVVTAAQREREHVGYLALVFGQQNAFRCHRTAPLLFAFRECARDAQPSPQINPRQCMAEQREDEPHFGDPLSVGPHSGYRRASMIIEGYSAMGRPASGAAVRVWARRSPCRQS